MVHLLIGSWFIVLVVIAMCLGTDDHWFIYSFVHLLWDDSQWSIANGLGG